MAVCLTLVKPCDRGLETFAAVAKANAAVKSVAGLSRRMEGRPDAGFRALCPHCGGVPHAEAARWWTEVANEVQLINEAVDAKLDLWRARMQEKDQVIKRLYVKVKQLSDSGRRAPGAEERQAHVSPQAEAPQAPVAQNSGGRSPLRAAVQRGNASPTNHTRPLLAAQSMDGFQAAFLQNRQPRAGSLSPSGRASGGANGTGDANGRSFEARPSLQSPTAAAARKTRPREAAERVQILYLRQEIAQLRRQNAELQGQVRLGDAQMESLSGMVKELQANQEAQKSRTQSSAMALQTGAGPGSGASTPANPLPVSVASPTSAQGESTRAFTSRRLSMDLQPSIAATRVSAANQAQRFARAAEAGERGSASRPSSAFQRHKEQMNSRRVVVAAPQGASASQMARMFSPRSRQLQSGTRSVASCAALREPNQASAAAPPAPSQADLQARPLTGPAGPASSLSGSVAAARSASVDHRARTRIGRTVRIERDQLARRSLRRH
ncbi:unnamed protein product [Effrenium voratum]|nr:unnamed protein product [Effrenium voratum]